MKQTILNFIQKIETFDCEFLQNFSHYLKDVFIGDDFEEKPTNDKHMKILYNFLDDIYMLSRNGSALLGETPFNKLDFTKACLESCGGLEYAIVDCEGKVKKSKILLDYAKKYKDVPFVIFSNCENILKDDENLVLFKHLSEGNRRMSFPIQNGGWKDVIFKSWYIFLGNENKLPELMKKANAENGIQDHINAFIELINIRDFLSI